MPKRRKRGSRYEQVRKISRTGGYSYYVTIPRNYIDELEWREHQNVVVTLEGDTITIKDWKRSKKKGGKTKKTQ